MVANKINKSFWKKKRVLITGHSGFKGSWLSLWLKNLSAEVHGISLAPKKDEISLFNLINLKKIINSNFLDIRKKDKLKKKIQEIRPHIIFHLAAQPLVIDGYKMPHETIETNIMGTINLLEICKTNKFVKSIIIVTTDKVYENKGNLKGYDENSTLGGYDPYSSSKAAVEILTSSFKNSFFDKRKISIATARAGNVIGGGDWSKNRIIPDIIRAWNNNRELKIRNPQSVRPWQHVLDSLYGYILLAQKINQNIKYSGAYNFGPKQVKKYSVMDIANFGKRYFKNAKIVIKKEKKYHETKILKLNTKKTEKILNFSSMWGTSKSIKQTMNWYKKFYEGTNSKQLCLDDIKNYEKSANKQKFCN